MSDRTARLQIELGKIAAVAGAIGVAVADPAGERRPGSRIPVPSSYDPI